MKKLLRFFIIPVLATALTATLGLTSASAHSDSGEFRWLASAGMHDLGFLCGEPQDPLCPDAAMASNGDVIEIVGEGTLRIKDDKHKKKGHGHKHKGKVSGSGSYRHTDSAGNVVDVGTWTARKLLDFESFGPSTVLPSHWLQGQALIRIHMVSQFGDMEAIAELELGCRLPAPVTATPAGTIEGIRLKVKGGLNFDMALDPRATLFLQISDDD
jgi:hypothetical protein